MAFEYFSISTQFPAHGQQELNRFLRNQRVLNVQQQVVGQGSEAHWTVCMRSIEMKVVKFTREFDAVMGHTYD